MINLMDALPRSLETERGGKQEAVAKARGGESVQQKKKKSR
jgi:hypothetical protein